jgi:hypothetical protein
VPLADVFNHKASVVELAEGYVVGEEADQQPTDSDAGGSDSASESEVDMSDSQGDAEHGQAQHSPAAGPCDAGVDEGGAQSGKRQRLHAFDDQQQGGWQSVGGTAARPPITKQSGAPAFPAQPTCPKLFACPSLDSVLCLWGGEHAQHPVRQHLTKHPDLVLLIASCSPGPHGTACSCFLGTARHQPAPGDGHLQRG